MHIYKKMLIAIYIIIYYTHINIYIYILYGSVKMSTPIAMSELHYISIYIYYLYMYTYISYNADNSDRLCAYDPRSYLMHGAGKAVDLHIYAEEHNVDKCGHAMLSLKESMAWDERTFGLEYDLNLFNIVAVDSFNFGAMYVASFTGSCRFGSMRLV